MFLGLAIFGFLWLVLAIVAIRANRRLAANGRASKGWLLVHRFSKLLGVVIGVAGVFIRYNFSENGQQWTILGFPFLAGVFDSHGADYAGILTLPATIGNFLFFAVIPQFILWVVGARSNRVA
jgi:hypothetical protein